MKKEFRVRKNEEFTKIIKQKHSLASKCFVVYTSDRRLSHARVGISVSKKMGCAVVRNKIKRQVRSMIDDLVDFENCPKDLLIIVKMAYLESNFEANNKDLEKLYKKAII